jgi:hypothetical protein
LLLFGQLPAMLDSFGKLGKDRAALSARIATRGTRKKQQSDGM